jgi:hypothetical protein
MQISSNRDNHSSNKSTLHQASDEINRLWGEEVVKPGISIKSPKDLKNFLARLENDNHGQEIEIQRLGGATTALILKVKDLKYLHQVIVKLPFLHRNSDPSFWTYVAGIDNEKRNLEIISKLSSQQKIHRQYWQQLSNQAPSGEHSINSQYINNSGNLAQLMFGVDSLTSSKINPIQSLQTTPVSTLAEHLETFLKSNELPIFTDHDVYNIFHDVMPIAGAGIQLIDAGGLQNTLVRKDGDKYQPTIIDLDPFFKHPGDLYQLMFSDKYQQKLAELQNSQEIDSEVIKLVSAYSKDLGSNDFTKIRRIAAALGFLNKLLMFQNDKVATKRNNIINQVNETINPTGEKDILNLRLQNEIQLRRIIRRSLEEGSFTKIELKQAINYLKEVNHLIPIISKEGIKVLESFRNI